MLALRNVLGLTSNGQAISYQYLHNESHLAGVGDIVKTIKQMVEGGTATDDYDLVEMLRDASEKVQTRKLLLVAHSQGNFYANAFYDKVAGKDGGVPTESLGMYSVATPADRVAGGGRYLTSESDKVIAGLVGSMPLYRIMPPNTHIALQDSDDALGHNFAGVYLKYKGAEIVRDIEEALEKLTANTIPLATCLEPPKLTLAHKVAGIALAIADPVANGTRVAVLGTVNGIRGIGTAMVNAGRFVAKQVASVFTTRTNADSTRRDADLTQTNAERQAGVAVLSVSAQPTTNSQPPTTDTTTPAPSFDPSSRAELTTGQGRRGGGESNPPEPPRLIRENNPPRQPPQVRGIANPPPTTEVGTPSLTKGEPEQKTPTYSFTPTIGSRGGGGGGVSNPAQPSSTQTSTDTTTGTTAADTTAPSAPVITSPSTTAASTTTTVTFTGTAEAGSVISTNYSSQTVTVGSTGAWSFTLTLPQGTTTLQVYATDTASNRSTAADYSVFVDSIAPSAPAVASPSSTATSTATSVSFAGTAEAGAVISTDFSSATTTANGSGAWSLTLSLSQGTNSLIFYATDAVSNRSVAATKTVTVDSLSPDVSLQDASACADTLVSGSCFVATTTLSFSWSSSATDLAYYALSKNGTYATTTATSTAVTATDQSTYSFSVAAVDSAGNRSATSTKTAQTFLMPVVINEVAWAGVSSSNPNYEWIELYNRTSQNLSLANWQLYADEDGSIGSPDLDMDSASNTTISAGAYYLIERKIGGNTEATESPVLNITADMFKSFGSGLSNSGENLYLVFKPSGRATTTIDYVLKCGSGWCGGSSSDYTTMERYDTSVAGTVASNWYSHLGDYIQNGTAYGGGTIKGTPKARNSVSYLIAPAADRILTANKTLTAANSPYFIDPAGFTVPSGTTLTVSAGVVVKNNATSNEFKIAGTLVANGTAASPVVITSLYDDTYGGDLNGDGSATTPAAGNWRRLLFETTSAGSSLTNTIVRYGGNANISDPAAKKGAVGVDSATVSFDGLVVERSNFHGLSLTGTGSTVTNSRFSTSTNSSVSGSGLYISGGSPTISASVFSGNYIGATLESSGAALSNNTFVGNTGEALYTTGTVGSFSGNSGSGNGVNAILLGNGTTITTSGATTTLAANSSGATALPYLVKGTATVTGNSTLSFSANAVIKGYDSRSSNYGEIVVQSGGKLHASGTTSSDIVFTSIKDTSVGGTTEADIGSAAAGAWNGITVEAGGMVDLTGVTLRYAGHKADTGFPVMGESAGALKITGSSAASGRIAQVLFDQNYQSGLNLASVSSLSVSTATFSNHTLERLGTASGLYASNSTSTLSNITFSGNEKDAVGAGTNTLSCTSCTPASPATSPANLFTQ